MKDRHGIDALAQTLIRLAPEHLPHGRGLLRGAAIEHPGTTIHDAKAALGIALAHLDEFVRARVSH